MKNKRGFTLVELLGTISLIAIILAIVSVSYINITKHIRLSYYKTLEESVLVAGSEYYAYTSNRPNMFGEEKKVSLAYLVENKYITNVVDKKGNTCSLDDSYITSYKNSSDKTKYYVCLICNSDDYKTSTLECNGSLDYTLKTYLTINDTGREYQEGTWVNKYVKVEYKTLNDIKEAIAKDQSGNIKKCNMTLKNGFRSCTLTLDVSGKYELYGTNGDKITSSITKDISVDKISPSFTIYEDTTRIENKVLKETTTDKTTVNINVKDIVDNESKVRSIKYSFGKKEEYVVVDNTKTEFSFTKEIGLGISDLIVVVEDYAGNITKKVVKYEVFNKTQKPTTEFCNNITYNGYEQILTEEAENGYKFINNKGTNAGEYTVSAVLDENYKWEDGTDSDISFVCKIERKPVAKEGTCKTLVYDGTTKALVSGGENITLINNEGKNANSYIVKMNANANYAFTDFSISKEIVCSIGKKDLIVVANSNQSKTYGSSDPTLTYTYSGNISLETPKFTGSLQRASGEAVGSYLINKGTLALIDNGTFLKNNYNLVFSCSTNFTITTKNISSLTITLDNTTYTYDKTEKRPNVVVKDGSKTLTLNTDYTLSYSNNINAGTAYVNITGIGGYTGSSSKSFVINKRSITVKANNQTINYGSSIAQGTGHITVSNLASGDIITSIKLTQSTTSATTNGVITPSNAIINSGNNNYNITYQNGTLVINRLKTATVGSCNNLTYNGTNQVLAKNGTNVTINNNEGKNAGSYTITFTANANYAFSDNTTSKTINCSIAKKALTITASNQNLMGTNIIDKSLSKITSTGLVSGDVITSITLTQSTTSDTTSGVITPSNAVIKRSSNNVSNNYSITYRNGNLTITNKKYCATFILNGASSIDGVAGNKSNVCCNPMTEASCTITSPNITPKTNFEVLGWTRNANNLIIPTDDSVDDNGNRASITLTKDETFYAVTKNSDDSRKTYMIEFDLNGASSYTIGGATYTSSETFSCQTGTVYNGASIPTTCTFTLPTIARNKSGAVIYGWNTSANSSSATYSVGQTITVSNNMVLHAITSFPLILYYNASGGTTTLPNQTKQVYNTEVGEWFDIPAYDRANMCRNKNNNYSTYKYIGLALTNGSNVANYCQGNKIYLTENTTLYAVWKPFYATGQISTSGKRLRIRAAGNMDAKTLGYIESGEKVYVTGPKTGDGNKWYPVIWGKISGYSYASNVKNVGTVLNSCEYTDYVCGGQGSILTVSPEIIYLNLANGKTTANISVESQCGSITGFTSSNPSLVNVNSNGVVTAVSGSVPYGSKSETNVKVTTRGGCPGVVRVIVKNINETAPNVNISISGTQRSSGYESGAVVSITCESEEGIASFNPVDSKGKSFTITGNDTKKTATITLKGSSSSRTISASCTSTNGLSTSKSSSYRIYQYSASSACGVKSYSYSGTCTCKISSMGQISKPCNSSIYSQGGCQAWCKNQSNGFSLDVNKGSCSRSATYKTCWHY